MGVLIALLCLLLIGLIPLGIRAQYNDNGAYAQFMIGPFCIARYPKVKNLHTGKSKGKKSGFESRAEAKKQRKNIKDYLPILQLVLDFLHDFRSKLKVNNLNAKVVLGGTDPADLSVKYGYAWAVVGSVMPLLEGYFTIKNRNVEIECDYTAEKDIIDLSLDLTITLAKLLTIVLYHGWKVLRKYFQITNKIKDGARL